MIESKLVEHEEKIRSEMAHLRADRSATEAEKLEQAQALAAKLDAVRPRSHRSQAACQGENDAALKCYR